MKLFEMFSGYGGASWGLKKAGIDYECIGISEVDKYAVECYNNNFPGVKNYGDCSKIDPTDIPDFDLLTGGFPCQDVSLAGKRDLTKGRTNLYLEILRVAQTKKPKFMLLENVKGLLSVETDEGKLIYKIIRDLNKIGYDVCWKVLNSKEHGIPQNRERIWFVCKLGTWNFMEFQFPNTQELKIFLKDILEEDIDKKYYLSKKQIEKIIERNKNFNMKGNRFISSDSNYFSGLVCSGSCNDILTYSLYPRSGNPKKGGTGQLSKGDGTSYCLDTGNNQAISCLDLYNHKVKTDGTCITLTEPHHNDLRIHDKKSIRKLTPKECFRLMGFLNDEINLEGLSDNQLYKLAGNGWDINLVSKILHQLCSSTNKSTQEKLC